MAETVNRDLPTRTHVYQNWNIDSARWDAVPLRADDIVITTSYKAGTTWMQVIVGNLIFGGQEPPAPMLDLSQWPEARMVPPEVMQAELARQTNRRVVMRRFPVRHPEPASNASRVEGSPRSDALPPSLSF